MCMQMNSILPAANADQALHLQQHGHDSKSINNSGNLETNNDKKGW